MDLIKRLRIVVLTSATCLVAFEAKADVTFPWLKNEKEVEAVSPSILEEEVATPSPTPFTQGPQQFAPQQLNMTEAVQQAVSWHPNISESVGALFEQKQNIKAARAGYFPQLNVGVIAGRDTESRGSGDGHALQLYVSQLLYDFGKVSSDVDFASASTRKSQATLLQSIDQVARDTAKAAIEVQRYQVLLEASQEQIDGVSSIARLVRMRSDRGASSRSDVLQAQTRMEAARASKQQVEAQLNRWRSNLQNLMGSQYRFSMSMHTPDAVTGACQIDSPNLSTVPEVLIAEAARAEVLAQVEEARAESWPTLSLDASVNRYLDQQYVDSNALNDHESAIFLNLSMPIYQGGRLSANKESSLYALRAADAAKDAARLSVVQEFRAAKEEAQGLKRSLAILDSRERAIAETRNLYKKQYSSLGTRTLLDLLNSERELHQARLEKNNTIFDLHRLQIDCLYNIGALRSVFQLEGMEIQGVEVLP